MLVKNIYVIGFPKSGNTWLTRLVARCLKKHVCPFPTGLEFRDIAADVNDEIEKGNEGEVFKLHYIPSDFVENMNISEQDKIIYIKRNYLDVFVSSFFYFFYKGSEKDIYVKQSFAQLLNPINCYRWAVGRWKVGIWINTFCIDGIGVFGTWKEHLRSWSNFLEKTSVSSACITYEDLRRDPEVALEKVFSDLNILDIDKKHIVECIRMESFEFRKKEIDGGDKTLTFGRSFNSKFLRSGKVNGFKNFLTPKQITKLEKLCE